MTSKIRTIPAIINFLFDLAGGLGLAPIGEVAGFVAIGGVAGRCGANVGDSNN